MGPTVSVAGRALQVLVVDDTIVYRKILKDIIGELPGVEVSGTAANGRLAIAKMEHSPADFVVLDIEMPEMNGLEALDVIRRRWPEVGVLMVSGGSRSAADLTVEALSRGAIDFLPKADGPDPAQNRAQLKQQLGFVLRTFSTQWSLRQARSSSNEALRSSARPPEPLPERRSSPIAGAVQPKAQVSTGLAERSATLLRGASVSLPPPIALPEVVAPRPTTIEVVVIGTSTGGPQALGAVIPKLPGDLGVPVLIVQHMPPVFTASLARNLDSKSALTVREAREGEVLEANVALIAPGGFHMVVQPDRRIALTQDPPENSCRPAVDVLFRSVATAYRGHALAIVMTGMGDDGARGVASLKERGCYCLTQDEASCTIYGMPRAVDQAGLSDERLPLERLASRIAQLVSAPRS